MSRALYRTYRSKKLSEVVGQEHITATLSNALKAGQISHAYLLTGPRGVGKTSVARILAHEINNLPYDDDSEHLDIIEIDAASNRRIDEIRDLREKVHLAPTSAKYKVYIIDEVHMLTREAFNALLKTLEEPPEHVIFILATTELHKLPETIISRTQRFGFRPIAAADMVSHLRSIAKKEKIQISDDALAAITEHAGGSFRDGISLLDQARGYGDAIELRHIEELLGHAPLQSVQTIIESSLDGRSFDALNAINSVLDSGTSPEMLTEQLIRLTRQRLISENATELAPFTSALLAVPGSHSPRIALELAVFTFASRGGNTVAPAPAPEPTTREPKAVKSETPKPKETKKPTEEPKPEEKAPASPPPDSLTEMWISVLADIKGQHNTLYGILRMAEMTSEKDGEITLGFQFPFHMKRAAEGRHRTIIESTVKKIAQKEYAIHFIKRTMESPKKSSGRVAKPVSDKKKSEDTTLDAVKDIFGGGELMN